jgi:ferredoxin
LGQELFLDGLARGFDAILLAVGDLPDGKQEIFGLPCTPTGLVVEPETFQTTRPGVFAAGSAVKRVPQLVRAMSEGRSVAQCIDQFLTGRKIHRPDRPLSSVMGRLGKEEVQLFMNGVSSAGRCSPSCGALAGFNSQEATGEAQRCLHCDCRSVGHCELQRYAEIYQVDPSRFRSQRRPFEQQRQPGGIIFEPGKCILCGICVQLAEQAKEQLGLTFIGRGFNVQIGAPFRHTITEGLQKVAAQCVEHCPTGALVFDDSPDQKG